MGDRSIPRSASSAAPRSCPVRSGMVCQFVPRLTCTVSAWPSLTVRPAAGCCPHTSPASTAGLYTSSQVTASAAAVGSASASARVRPSRSGTSTSARRLHSGLVLRPSTIQISTAAASANSAASTASTPKTLTRKRRLCFVASIGAPSFSGCVKRSYFLLYRTPRRLYSKSFAAAAAPTASSAPPSRASPAPARPVISPARPTSGAAGIISRL